MSSVRTHGRQPLVCWLVALAMVLAAGPAESVVLVVTSDDLPQYRAPIDAFATSLHRETRVVNIEGSRSEGERLLREAARDDTIEAVFALGSQAAYLSREILPERPMVFAMVLDWNRYSFAQPASGIAVEMPVESLFTRFKLLLPDMQTVGVIHSERAPAATIAAARSAAASLGLELVEEDIRHAEDVAGAYRRMRTDVDALWMVPDATVVTRENFAYLSERTRRDGIAFLAFSENFVRAGALMSISPSYATMGVQAAVLVERLTAGDSTVPLVQAPLGSTMVINADTARAIGLELDSTVLGMADVVIEASASLR